MLKHNVNGNIEGVREAMLARLDKETREEVPGYHEINPGTEFADLLDYSKLAFDRMDLKEVLRCLKAWPDAGRYLSGETMKKLAAA